MDYYTDLPWVVVLNIAQRSGVLHTSHYERRSIIFPAGVWGVERGMRFDHMIIMFRPSVAANRETDAGLWMTSEKGGLSY